MDAGDLRLFLQAVHAVEDFMFERQLFRLILRLGKNAFHLLMEVLVFAIAPEIVDHQEATVE